MNEALAIMRCTIKELARSFHYKLLFLFLTIILQFSFLIAVLYQFQFTIRSPNLGYNVLQFLVGNLDPIHFFSLQFVVVALTLVHSERMRSRDVLESVHAKSYGNVWWMTGSVLGISVLVFLIPIVNLLAIFVATALGGVFGFDLGTMPEQLSSLNLILVDVPTTIAFYCGLAMLLHQVLHNRVLSGFSTLSIAFLHLFLIQSVPFSWREVVSHSTTDSLLVSEILPYFSTGWILFNRLTWFILAIGLIVVAALFERRRDAQSSKSVQVAMVCIGLGFVGLMVHGLNQYREGKEHQRVAATHETTNVHARLDLTKLTGKVEVDPGVSLYIDVDLSVQHLSDGALDSLQFSFNPGMELKHVRVDDFDRAYSFVDGLITIPLTSIESTNNAWTVSIRASGIPDVDFGYPDPEIDFLRDPGLSLQIPKLLGLNNSIFDQRFVVLMPGSRWYPVPQPLGTDKSIQSLQMPIDTFSIDLAVHIANKNWILAAPERTLIASDDSLHYKIHSDGEVPHFAIVASEFQSSTKLAAGVEIEFLIHNRHFHPKESSTAIWLSMLDFIAERLTELSDDGLPFPYRSLTFVEVPNHLRLIGGYDMPFLYSHPGVVFMRESGFPTANLDREYKRISKFDLSDSERIQYFTERLFYYDYTNILGGNVLENVSSQYFPFIDHSLHWEGRAVKFLKRFLITDTVMGPDDFGYSPADIALIEEISNMTAIYPIVVLDTLFRVFKQPDPSDLVGETYYRRELSDASFSVQSMKMSELLRSDDIWLRKAALESRLTATYAALVKLYGSAKLNDLLDLELERIAKHSNPQSDIGENDLEEAQTPLIPILTEWNESTHAPAFSTSELEVVKVAVEGTPYTHRTSFKIRNDSNVTGVVSFKTDLSLETIDTGICAEIPGQTAYQVHLYTEEDIYAIVFYTYYSKNRGGEYLKPMLRSYVESKDVIVEKMLPPLTEISWNPDDGNTVIVDNLDPGFVLVGHDAQPKPGLMETFRWPWEMPALPARSIRGVNRFDWSKPQANRTWRFLEHFWLSYGKYRSTALATYGNRAEIARFTADIPLSGKWSLSYYLQSDYPWMDILGVHNFILHNSQLKHHIDVDPQAGIGWIQAGEFDIPASTVHLDLVSVDPPNSLRVADAVRWTLVSKNNN